MEQMKAKKSLGQNFLIDEKVINKIDESILATPNDLIIEIGPGMGALTKKLKAKGSFLLAYEIDHDLESYLKVLEDEKVKIIWQDILTSDIKNDIKNIKYENLYIVGNLPYYITTPIIKYLISLDLNANEMLFMVQDEVADRFTALPKSKEYGSMTLYLKYYFEVKKLFKVDKNCFKPIPKVDSAIIKLEKRKDKPNVKEDDYFKIINESFRMKRKTLKNNLSNYDFPIIKAILDKYQYKENVRAEELEEEVFVEITHKIEENKEK